MIRVNDALRRYPRLALLVGGIVLVSGFRPMLVRRAAASRVVVAGGRGAAAMNSSSSFANSSSSSFTITSTTGGGGGGGGSCDSRALTTTSSCSPGTFNEQARLAALEGACASGSRVGSCPVFDVARRGDWVYRSICTPSYCERTGGTTTLASHAATFLRRAWSSGVVATFVRRSDTGTRMSFRCTPEVKDRSCILVDSARTPANSTW